MSGSRVTHEMMASLYFETCLYMHTHGALYSRYDLVRMPADNCRVPATLSEVTGDI